MLVPELAEAASRTADRALLEYVTGVALGAHPRDQLRVGDAESRRVCGRCERGRGRRRSVPPSRSTHLSGTRVRARARPDPPSLRGVAAPRTSPPRRPKAFAHRARGAHRHGRRGVRAPRRTRAAGDRRACPQTDRRTHSTNSPPRRRRLRAWRRREPPIGRSRLSCSSARAPSSTTCARRSASSTSSRGHSSLTACATSSDPPRGPQDSRTGCEVALRRPNAWSVRR